MLVSQAVGPGYQHVGGNHAVEVFRQTESPLIDLVAEGDIDAPPALVRGILLDYPNAHALSEHVTESRVLTTGTREIIVYQRLKLPVVSDRDFTLHAMWGQRGANLWTRFTIDNSHGPVARDGIVRLTNMTGGWDLQPIRGGAATHAVYRVQMDMAGSIPKWMVSGGAAKDLPKLFDGIRHEVVRRSATASN
jgi:hypothetical protein